MTYRQKLEFAKQASFLDNDAVQIGGSFIPGVSSVLAGRNAYNAFRGGRYLAGAGHTALAGLGLIPGLGFAGGLLKGVGRAAGSASRAGNVAHSVGTSMGHMANAAGRALPGAKTVLGANVGGVTSIGRGFRANNRLALAGMPVGIGESMQIARQQSFQGGVDNGLDMMKSIRDRALQSGPADPLTSFARNSYSGLNRMAGAIFQ